MRTLTDQQTRLYALRTRVGQVRVDLSDGDSTFQDMTTFLGHNWIVSVEWGEDVDTNLADATIMLRRDLNAISLVPTMLNSRANASTSGDPLIALRRRVRIYGGVSPDRVGTPATWVLLFDGRVTDLALADQTITLTCVDRFGELVNRWIEAPATYSDSGGHSVESVMQDILDDNGTLFSVYTPTSPGWNVTEFQTECQSLADELTMLSDQIGWYLRWKWDAGTSAYRLTFGTFDRATTTSLYTLSSGYYFDISADTLSEADIRNVVEVTYSDPADLDSDGAPTRKTVTKTDGTSITKYGRRWMSICEASTSNIDTATEANTLAQNVLDDLSDPVAVVTVDAPFLHFVELGDVYTLGADNVRFSSDQTISVTGYRHRIDADTSRTSITVRTTTAAGGSKRWIMNSGTPGIAELQDVTGPPAPSCTVNEANAHVEVLAVASRRPGYSYEVHTGAVGFTPILTGASTTFRHRASAHSRVLTDTTTVPVGELQDVVVYAVDDRGNRSSGTRVSSKRAKRVGPQFLAPEARGAPGLPGGVFALQTRGATYAPDGWSIRTGTWATDANLDSGGTYAAPKTGAYGLLLASTAVATALYSDPFAVTVGRTYAVQTEVKASDATHAVTVAVEWLDAAQSVASTETLYSSALAASDTWQLVSALVSPPSGAAYARVVVSKAASAFSVLFDRVLFDECPEPDNTIHGIRLFDDFDGSNSAGALAWSLYLLGADAATNPTIPSKASAATGGFTWSERGVVQLTTPGVGDYGGIVSLGPADWGYGLPPVGTVFRIKIKASAATNLTMWAGLFDSVTTFPDGALANSLKGVGVRAAAAGGAVNWKAITRDGTSETAVDLGVAMGTTWRTVGFRRTLTGIQPMIGDHATGSEITTNVPSLGACSLMFGAYETSAAARTLSVDLISLFGNFRRYDP